MKKLLAFLCLLCGIVGAAHADGMQWNLPYGIGTVQLPTKGEDLLPTFGRDFVKQQTIVGVSSSLLTLYKEVNGYVGVVGEFHSQAPNVQPYLALGADVAKYIPIVNQFKALQVHGFGRYVSSEGGSFTEHLGAGIAVAYSFK